ncbi:MBL fold metallo-hydrolase [Glaciibacter psychrotolerans]|uniref:Glyoxylase-like metal-dependent hydrolase (Beta-lactamase superfamily II) n=1 Tax=Glaciibacter psychrotolerans TaxID=670054 RepID=A0A7Z0EGP2_9MICO|nr:MBL fold metallo-hydrolase [Leifsonia psychrotolerans]NYJ21303.1 glyoxylase-like metal-dependent hydrolase (beta-lactamase superfamily II) [Leifsonia psychrotolerans]
MSAITLRPGVHLVGSGAAGFDLSDALDCHVYLIEGTTGWAVIDAGSGNDSARIVASIRSVAAARGLDLTQPGTLLLTHGHADHSGGTADLLAAFPTLTAYAGAAAAEWVSRGDLQGISLDRGKASGAYPADYAYGGAAPVLPLAGGETRGFGGRSIRVIAAPGHARGHLCFLLQDNAPGPGSARILFSGDCVFTRGRISLQNLHDVDIPAYANTLAVLDGLNIDALLPGHYSVSLSNAARHIRIAHDAFQAGSVPPNAP